MKSIAVYCGANHGTNPTFTAVAQQLGHYLAVQQISMVYGGGNVGLMGVVADAVLAAGGQVIGVMPTFLIEKELAHPSIQSLHQVQTMHERKAKMLELSDGVIAMPGGLGTLDELFEAMTWLQLGQIQHPIGLLDTEQFYQPLISMLRHLVQQGFVRQAHLDMLQVHSGVEALITGMRGFQASVVSKWT
jgi:uncharacterized protein (TIGR00730 family)